MSVTVHYTFASILLYVWFVGLSCSNPANIAASDPRMESRSSSPDTDDRAPKASTKCSWALESRHEIPIWAANINGARVCWTDRDLYIDHPNGKRKLFSRFAENHFRKLTRGQSEGSYELSFRLVSVVGQIATVEVVQIITAPRAANVAGEITWLTVDLLKPGELPPLYQDEIVLPSMTTELTDLFSESEILSALLADAEVSDAVSKRPASPSSLGDLLDQQLVIRGNQTLLTRRAMRKFRFDQLSGDKMVVSIELHDVFNPRVGQVESLQLSLAVPETLISEIKAARNETAGFFAQGTSYDQRTKIEIKIGE